MGATLMPTSGPEGAWHFFRSVESYLNRRLPPPAQLRQDVDAIVCRAKRAADPDPLRHLNNPEHAFANRWIVPALYDYLVQEEGLSADQAMHALLSESHKSLRELTSQSPKRAVSHLFGKQSLGMTATKVWEKWTRGIPPHTQSCPDIALRSPAPSRAVIDVKYFTKGSERAAGSALAASIYHAFFYLGLPTLPETEKHAAWQYDYTCLLAFDATDDGALARAWASLPGKVREACWKAAKIYVMILRGGAAVDQPLTSSLSPSQQALD